MAENQLENQPILQKSKSSTCYISYTDFNKVPVTERRVTYFPDQLYSTAFGVNQGHPPVDYTKWVIMANVIQSIIAPYLYILECCQFQFAYHSLVALKASKAAFEEGETELAARMSHKAGRKSCRTYLFCLTIFLVEFFIGLLFIIRYLT